MIKNIKIKNFKTLKDVDIALCDTLNVISGVSSEGKTAFLSAINLVCTNRPTGNGYISYFADDPKETNIEIEFSDGVVEFEKTEKTAKYLINKDNNFKFTDLNKTVPDEVKALTKMDEDSFSSQFDLPYLILGPSAKTELSKKINETLGIQKFDDKQREINKTLLSLNREYKQNKSTLLELKLKKKKLKDIDKIEFLFSKLKELEDEEIKNEELHSEITWIKRRLKNKDNLKKIEENIETVKCKLHQINSIEETIANNEKIIKIKAQIDKYISLYQKLNKLKATEKTLDKLEEKLYKINEEENANKDKLKLIKMIKLKKEKVKNTISEIYGLKDQLKEFKICPECGQELREIV